MHTLLQGQQEKKIDILEKELTNKAWLIYGNGLWIWTGVTKKDKEFARLLWNRVESAWGGEGFIACCPRLSVLSTQLFFVSWETDILRVNHYLADNY